MTHIMLSLSSDLSSHLLSKNLKTKIKKKHSFTCCFVWV